MLKLHLGCGEKLFEGFVNVDILSPKTILKFAEIRGRKNSKNVEYKQCNLDKYPLPWKTDSVDYIFADSLLEVIEDPIKFMLELHRICKSGAIIDIWVPHFSLGIVHAYLPNKRAGFSCFTFDSWMNKDFYEKFRVQKKLIFTRRNYTWLNYIFNPIINLSQIIYERFFCYMLPCSQIKFRLTIIKK